MANINDATATEKRPISVGVSSLAITMDDAMLTIRLAYRSANDQVKATLAWRDDSGSPIIWRRSWMLNRARCQGTLQDCKDPQRDTFWCIAEMLHGEPK